MIPCVTVFVVRNNKDISFDVKHLISASNETRAGSAVHGSHEGPTFAVDAKAFRRSRHHLRELQRAAGELIEESSNRGQLKFTIISVSAQSKG